MRRLLFGGWHSSQIAEARRSRCWYVCPSGFRATTTGGSNATTTNTFVSSSRLETPCLPVVSSSSTTSALFTSVTTTMSQAQCTATLVASCEAVDGQDTSTHVGGPKAKVTPPPLSMPTTLQSKWKQDGVSEYSSTLNTKTVMGSLSLGNESSSACEAQEEVEKRKLEQDAHDAEEAAPPKKKKKSLPVPNEIHMKMRAVIDEESKWEKELEQIHGLAEEEVSMVMRIVTKHYNDDAFPDNFDPTATGGIDYYRALAKTGWQKMKECREIMARYPREGSEQTCIHGVWKMIPAYDW